MLFSFSFSFPCRREPAAGALFALNMLVGTRSGSSYSGDEYSAWLREAGFSEIRHITLPVPTSLMVGVRAAGAL